MKRYRVRLVERAEADVAEIYRFVRRKSASTSVARNYIARIRAFLAEFETFPERGTVRANVREGLRIVGFERRVSVAFVVEDSEVIVLRILYAGQEFESNGE
ncbi:type II toxin-antitoxin system RelE/ParE family toxin [Rhizobium sp. 2YAF20]|uniref:type II toxin-antitoxin system RelE/ParE family toxin n=1 Tax=Rhizobium sp. 2YAF20 TaxID=3233027 RepID=UPI003F9A6347